MVSGLALAAALAGVGGEKAYANSKEESLLTNQAGQSEVEAMKTQLKQVSDTVAKAEDLVETDQAAYEATVAERDKQEGLLTEAKQILSVLQKDYDVVVANLAKEKEKAALATPETMTPLRTELDAVKATVITLQASANQATAQAVDNAKALEVKKQDLVTLKRQKEDTEADLTLLKQRVTEQEAALAAVEAPKILSYLSVAQQGVENAKQLVAEAEKRLALAIASDGDKANAVGLSQLALDTATKALDLATSDYLAAKQEVARLRETLVALENSATGVEPLKLAERPSVRPSEVSRPDNTNSFVALLGNFATPLKDVILNRINAIRQEAYQSGLIAQYVPIKWSKSLEEMAMIRVAEASVTRAHKRLTDKDWSSVEDPYPFEMWEESVGYTTAVKEQAFLETIEQFYREKGANYEALINPEYTHLGMAAFQASESADTTAVLQLFANETSLDESLVGTYGEMYQELEAETADLSDIGLRHPKDTLQVGRESVALTLTGTLASRYKEGAAPATVPVALFSGVSWISTDPTVATVDDKGLVTPLKPGTVSIRAIYRGLAYAKTFVVKEAMDVTKAQDLLAKAEEAVREKEAHYQRAQAAFEVAKSSHEKVASQELLRPAAQEQYDRYQAELQKAEELTQKIRAVGQQFEQEKATQAAALEAARAQVAAKEKEVASLTDRLAADQESLIGYEVNLASFQSRVAVRQKELAAITERLSDLKKQISELEASGNRLQEAERATQKANELLKKQQATVTAITGKVTTLKTQATILQKKLAEAKEALAAAKAQQVALQEAYKALVNSQVKTEDLVKQYNAILDKGGLPVPVYDDNGQITGYVDKVGSSAPIGVTSPPGPIRAMSTASPGRSEDSLTASPQPSSQAASHHTASQEALSQLADSSGKTATMPTGSPLPPRYPGVASGTSYGYLPKTGDQSSYMAAVAGAVVTTAAMTAVKRRKKEAEES